MSERALSPFEWLYDGLPEDGLEDHADLRGDLAETPEAAAAKLTYLYERDSDHLTIYGPDAHFAPGRKVWLRANVGLFDEDCEELGELHGTEAETYCSTQDRLDELFYVGCNPNDEGAAEWWRCELVLSPAVSVGGLGHGTAGQEQELGGTADAVPSGETTEKEEHSDA